MAGNPAQLTMDANLGRHPGGEQQVGTACLPEHTEQRVDAGTDRVSVHWGLLDDGA
jgi:hypothetical protein